MNIYMNRLAREGAWGGGNHAVRALQDSPLIHLVGDHTTVYDTSRREYAPPWSGPKSDIILVMGIDQDVLGPKEDEPYKGCIFFHPSLEMLLGENKKTVLRVNDCDVRKGTADVDRRLLEASKHLAGTIFVSQWMHDYFMEKGWACKKNTVIINGVADHFSPRTDELNVFGPTSIVTHHWSDNPLKGQDYVEWLDDFVGRFPERFQYTFIGRTKARLKNTWVSSPLWGSDLSAALASHDICINASRFDPGPNSVIESIACGLPTYVHRDGGGGAEFAGADHTFSSFDELERILLAGNYQPNQFTLRTWDEFSSDVFEFMKEVHDEH